MGWWTVVSNGAKTIGDGAAWAWNKTPILPLINYGTNTAFHIMEQGLALRDAIPALVSPPIWKVIKGMGNVLFYDVLPLATVNYLNNGVQNYFRAGYNNDQASIFAPYAIFLGSLSLIDYGIQAYTLRQGTNLILHTLALDALGPSSFNHHKASLPPAPTLCIEEECNFKRKFKGSLREPLVLNVNDLILWGVKNIPHIGEKSAWILGLYFYGEYITRMATPERCERHKAMKSESVLSLGLTFALTSAVMDYCLESTVGMPPFLVYRTLRHFLLLLHINLAAHMVLPLVKQQKDAINLDPLVIYERSTRFVIDVVFEGLLKRIPKDFPPTEKPYIPLSTLLKFLTNTLDGDLEQVRMAQPGFFKKTIKTLVPSTFHSTKNLVNDPVIKLFWPDIQKGMLNTVELIESAGKPVATLTTGPKPIASAVKYTLSTVLNYKFGLSIKTSEFLLSLSKKEDFWNFITALKHWLERNNVSYEVLLTKSNSLSALHEDNRIIELPPEPQGKEIAPPAQNLITPQNKKEIEADSLMPIKTRGPTSVTASSLFTTRQRPNKAPVQSNLFQEDLLSSLSP